MHPCRRFNSGAKLPRVCLLSVDLAVGINLVGANHLIMLGPSYNPTVDVQAMARIHRPGAQATGPRRGSSEREACRHSGEPAPHHACGPKTASMAAPPTTTTAERKKKEMGAVPLISSNATTPSSPAKTSEAWKIGYAIA